jgi:hypothetical protein
MKTESTNKLAEIFEVDRATMQRALRSVLPDSEVTPGRPCWKLSTAMNALVAHRASTGRADSRRRRDTGDYDANWQDPLLVQLYAQQDEADDKMRKQPTLEARRAAAIGMIPLISRVDAATRERGKINGGNPDAVDMRADVLYQMQLRGLEECCQWSHEETWTAMSDER